MRTVAVLLALVALTQAEETAQAEAKPECAAAGLVSGQLYGAEGTCIRVQSPPFSLVRPDLDQIVRDLPFVLSSITITHEPSSQKPAIAQNNSNVVGTLFTLVRTAASQFTDSSGTVVWLEDNVYSVDAGQLKATVKMVDEVSAAIVAMAVLVWIIAPYIANKGTFSFTIFFLAIIVVLSAAVFLVWQRIPTPAAVLTAAVGAIGVFLPESMRPNVGALGVEATKAFMRGTGIAEALNISADNETAMMLLVAVFVFVLCCIGLFGVFYIPATEERLQSFSTVIRISTLPLAALAGSSRFGIAVCLAVPVTLHFLGLVVALFVALDSCARWLAGAVSWLVSVLCCPCIRCAQCVGQCCYNRDVVEEANAAAAPEAHPGAVIGGLGGDGSLHAGMPVHMPQQRSSDHFARRSNGGSGRSSSNKRSGGRRPRPRPATALNATRKVTNEEMQRRSYEATAEGMSQLHHIAQEKPEEFAGRLSDEAGQRMAHFASVGEDVTQDEFEMHNQEAQRGFFSGAYEDDQDISEEEMMRSVEADADVILINRRHGW